MESSYVLAEISEIDKIAAKAHKVSCAGLYTETKYLDVIKVDFRYDNRVRYTLLLEYKNNGQEYSIKEILNIREKRRKGTIKNG